MRKRFNLRLLVALLGLCVATQALGTQLTPLLQDGELGMVLQDMNLPPTLRKDLVSGLTNRIVVQVTLLKAAQPWAQRRIGIAIKYDLWEETFAVKMTLDDTPVSSATCQNVDEVIAMLTRVSVPRLFAADAGAAGRQLGLEADILFDPIEKERLEEIRKWVAENDRPTPTDSAGLSSTLPVPRAANARLFDKIFEQYAAGATVAAAWKQTVTSKPFYLEELHNGL